MSELKVAVMTGTGHNIMAAGGMNPGARQTACMRLTEALSLSVTSTGKVSMGECSLPLIWIYHLALQLECI